MRGNVKIVVGGLWVEGGRGGVVEGWMGWRSGSLG